VRPAQLTARAAPAVSPHPPEAAPEADIGHSPAEAVVSRRSRPARRLINEPIPWPTMVEDIQRERELMAREAEAKAADTPWYENREALADFCRLVAQRQSSEQGEAPGSTQPSSPAVEPAKEEHMPCIGGPNCQTCARDAARAKEAEFKQQSRQAAADEFDHWLAEQKRVNGSNPQEA
jgi:hypothetical protein